MKTPIFGYFYRLYETHEIALSATQRLNFSVYKICCVSSLNQSKLMTTQTEIPDHLPEQELGAEQVSAPEIPPVRKLSHFELTVRDDPNIRYGKKFGIGPYTIYFYITRGFFEEQLEQENDSKMPIVRRHYFDIATIERGVITSLRILLWKIAIHIS